MPLTGLPGPGRVLAVLRGLVWAAGAVGEVRSQLGEGGVRATVPPPPSLPPAGIRGVTWGVALRRASCLERSLVLQRWHLAQGRERTVIIGVAVEGGTTLAHAWLEGEEHHNDRSYVEITRVPPS